jgi:diguanylate cyclase (GGDEF)-like protein
MVWLAGYALVSLGARTVDPGRRGERRRGWSADRSRTAAETDSMSRLARGSTLPLAVSVLALAVVTAAVLDAPVPRGAALLGLASLTLVLGRSVTAWAGRRMIADPNTDALTGLANRQALSRALSRDGIGGENEPALSTEADQVCLLLVDIDRFKDINAALGHSVGDRVLAEVGARLRSALPEGQLLARLGGDEFAVLLLGMDEPSARQVAQLLRESLKEPIGSIQIGAGQSRLHVQASVGIATCQLRRGRPEDLLRQADVAVSRAKSTGTGITTFKPERDRIDTTGLRRTDELRSALEHGDLEVHLQPQVNLATGAVVGAEALARWRHPQDGVLLPASFLPLAARTGLLRPVAALVLDKAIAACSRWWCLGHVTPVSINLTADDLRNPDLPDLLEAVLARHELPSSAICVEITEDALLADPPATAALLQRWRAAGVGVALDDFGTGYSSLAYLRDLPLDELKLDRAFISDLRNRTTTTIVRYTVAMAHALRLRVVGEGVEDAGTARLLADAGCDIGQGIYFGDAMDIDGFLTHLNTRRA